MRTIASLAGLEIAGAGVEGSFVDVGWDRRRGARSYSRCRIPIEITNQAAFNDYISSMSFTASDDYSPVHFRSSVGYSWGTHSYNHTPSVPISEEVLESGESEEKVNSSENDGKQCRICHLKFEGGDDEEVGEDYGEAMELGCDCKGDMATAHKKCALTWFLIKGDLNCEICGSIVHNVGVVVQDVDYEVIVQVGNNGEDEVQPPESSVSVAHEPENGSSTCMHGRRIVNLMLGCMTFAFVISWLFHFNVLH